MIYEFECDNCKKIKEVYTDRYLECPFIKCPKCKNKMFRIYSSNVSFNFKGEGTYKKGFDGYKK